jgi:hypothetical protein
MLMRRICSLLFFVFSFQFGFSQNLKWAKSVGGSGGDFAISTAIDKQGNIYSIGLFSGVADFDPGTCSFNLANS